MRHGQKNTVTELLTCVGFCYCASFIIFTLIQFDYSTVEAENPAENQQKLKVNFDHNRITMY